MGEREIVILTGVYGHRVSPNRVQPVGKGSRVTVSDEEAARLVALGVAAYTDATAEAADTPPAPPPGGGEPEGGHQDTPGEAPPAEATTGAAEGAADVTEDDPDAAEVKRLERMAKADLEQMAQDMGVDISGAKNNHERAVLIAAAGEPEDGEAPPDLGAGDIVQ